MHTLGLKKFLLDYFVGFVLTVLLLYFIVGKMTVLDEHVVAILDQSCSDVIQEEELQQNLQPVLRTGEQCEVVSPCVGVQSVDCKGTLQASEFYDAVFLGHAMKFRTMYKLSKTYRLASYKDFSTFRYTSGIFIFLMFYMFILIQASAMMFALWRQNKLKQTFGLPAGLRKDQLVKPAIFAVLLGISVFLMNYLVFKLFDHPALKNQQTITALFDSTLGFVVAIFLAPFVEELIFRGVLLRFFIEKRRALLGTVIVSLLFSFMHGFGEKDVGWQLYISSIYFIGSVLLCKLYIKQGTIWSPIAFHAAYNGTMFVFYTLLA